MLKRMLCLVAVAAMLAVMLAASASPVLAEIPRGAGCEGLGTAFEDTAGARGRGHTNVLFQGNEHSCLF